MNLFGKNLDRDVVVIAEIGVNHEGDVAAAHKLLDLAKQAGADAAKLQSYTPARYASASDPERLQRVTRFALSEQDHRDLAAHASEIGLNLFSTPLTEDVVPLLAELFPAIKIASGDLTFEPVIRAAGRTGRPVLISTGAGDMDEVTRAVSWMRDEVGASLLRERLVLLHCVAAYPAPSEALNLASIPFLAEQTELRVGFSNHMIGVDACLAAIAAGACVIEAHFTDRKSGRTFRDHELSLEPDEFARLVQAAPLWRAMRGEPGKMAQSVEMPVRQAIRKGVVAARGLQAGHQLKAEDLAYARPATEFGAADLPKLIGRTLKAPLLAGELIRKDQVE